MNFRLTEHTILALVTELQDVLKDIPDEQFCSRHPRRQLSCSEIYCHVIQVNKRCLLALERCIYGKQQFGRRNSPLLSRLILYLGHMAMQKISIPEHLAATASNATREDIRNELISFSERLRGLMPRVLKCSPHQRIKHQKLGLLNCAEWLRFMEIYTYYHLRQLRKVRECFS